MIARQVETRTLQALVTYKSRAVAKELGDRNREMDRAEKSLIRCSMCNISNRRSVVIA